MWKPVLVAMAVLAIAGPSIVFAQQRDRQISLTFSANAALSCGAMGVEPCEGL